MSHPYRKQRRAKREQRTEPQDEQQLSDGDKDRAEQCQCCGESPALDDTGLCKNCAGADAEDLRYW